MNDNEMQVKVIQSIAWALCAVLCTLIGSTATYYTIKDTAAIKAGLQQSVQATGGYWTK